jgi:hypothetical protein
MTPSATPPTGNIQYRGPVREEVLNAPPPRFNLLEPSPVGPAPQQQPQEEELISFDDPRFADYLTRAGSPERAEQVWAESVGWNEINRGIDNEMLALKQANPQVASGMLTALAESRKAELMAQAPGLQALQIAKQRLGQRREVATGLTSKFDGEQWAMINKLMREDGLFYEDAAVKTAELLPFDRKESTAQKPGARPSGPPSALDLLSPETKNVATAVYDAETYNQLRTALADDPATAMTFARNVVGILNIRLGKVDENDPASVEEHEQQKARIEQARAGLDIMLGLQRDGRGRIAIAKDMGGVQDAYEREAPVVIEMPDGTFQLKQFRNDDEVAQFAKEFLTQKLNKSQAADSSEKEQNPFSWIPRGVRKATGIQTVEETDRRIAKLEKSLADLENDPVKEPDLLEMLKIKEEIAGEKMHKEAQSKRETSEADVAKFTDIERRADELLSMAKNPRLDDQDKKDAETQAYKLMGQLEKMSELEAVQKILRLRYHSGPSNRDTGLKKAFHDGSLTFSSSEFGTIPVRPATKTK